MSAEATAGTTVVGWLVAAMPELPSAIRRERLAALRAQLISLYGLRAQLIDDGLAPTDAEGALFQENLLDMLVASLATPPSAAARSAGGG